MATFVRKTGFYAGTATSGTFTSSNDLVWSKTFTLSNGKSFNFRDLIRNGMTCTEMIGPGGEEAGACIASGK